MKKVIRTQTFQSFIYVTFSHIHQIPSSLADSPLEVIGTSDQMNHTVNSSEITQLSINYGVMTFLENSFFLPF